MSLEVKMTLFFLNFFSDSFKNRRCEFSSNGVQSFTWRVCCGAGRWQRGIFISWHSQLWMLCKYDLQWQYMISDSLFSLCVSQLKSLYSFMWMLSYFIYKCFKYAELLVCKVFAFIASKKYLSVVIFQFLLWDCFKWCSIQKLMTKSLVSLFKSANNLYLLTKV